MLKNYSKPDIISLLSSFDKEKRIRILKKCPNIDELVEIINATIISLNRICDTIKPFVADDIMMLIFGQVYLGYVNQLNNMKIELKSIILPEKFTELTTNESGSLGFYINDGTFIHII